ncbi:MAG: HAD family hydrolase [Fibrobacteres bacterium]|nr:HAD family hydrolase [Fibrobacterota bacterium]
MSRELNIKGKPALFLDRDGTIIRDGGYLSKPSQVKLYPYTISALKKLQKRFLLFIITNQSGISRGEVTAEQVKSVNDFIVLTLRKKRVIINEVYSCPHQTKDNCRCKKPKPYFLKKAAKDFSLNLKDSFIIGDHLSDAECGIRAGATPLYVLTGHGMKHRADVPVGIKICRNLKNAAEHILMVTNA